MAFENYDTYKIMRKPKTIKEMLYALHNLKKKNQYNCKYIDKIFDNISTTSNLGESNIEEMAHMIFNFHDHLDLFAIPTWEWVINFSKLLENKKVLEFGAGTGIISAMLKKLNIDIRAIDNYNRHLNILFDEIEITDGIEYLKEHKDEYDVLFFAWPEMNDTCINACDIFLDENKKIYYLGEEAGGCTADDIFFNKYDLKFINVHYTSLFGLHDNLFEIIKK